MLLRITLYFIATLVVLYPLQGVLFPEEYLVELTEDFPFAAGSELIDVKITSAYLWISNTLIAAFCILMAKYLSQPNRTLWLKISGWLLVAYPLVLSFTEVFMAFSLSKHLTEPSYTLEISSTNYFYALIGFVIVALANIFSSISDQGNNSEEETVGVKGSTAE